VLDFGVSFMADPPASTVVARTALAEQVGFKYAWLWDSHVLWQDPYPVLTLCAASTSTIHLGTCVTNPVTRDPTVTASAMATLQEISKGRMELGIGRGDSAQRVLGRTPVTVEHLEQACREIRELAAGREVELDGTPIHLAWSERRPLPIWIAAYGPKALRCAGRVADGVIMQIADPYVIEWSLPFLKEGAEQAGRSLAEITIMSAAPAYVTDDLAHARDQVRWFPALVSNHVVDLVQRYPGAALPHELTDFIERRKGYDYSHHARAGSENAAFVTDEVVDRFCVIGTAEQCAEKLALLESLGVRQFNIYSMVDDPEGVLHAFGEAVIPRLTAAGAAGEVRR
jgi:probable F420-dependent oxidoreductase